jgi:hypothetical protein
MVEGEMATQPHAVIREEKAGSSPPLIIAGCCLIMMAALVLGVGLPNHMVVRHVIQTAPLWAAVILGLRRSHASGLVGLPVFLFWLALMALIWLYLLGIVKVVSGTFSVWEITMTAVVGAACVVGIWAFVPLRSSRPPAKAILVFFAVAIVQFICFRISLLPAVAHR